MRNTHRPLTTLALALSLFMAALEVTVVSTAMPTVVGELGGIQSYAWVFTAYRLSSTMWMLIAFRTLQGLGAGAIQPVALTMIGDLYTMEERARVQGAFSAVWGVAGLVGPVT